MSEDLPLFSHARNARDGGDPKERVFRVAEINRAVRSLLETGFAEVWVEGEVSDFTRSSAGHVYFTLNDELDPAQVRCVMFRSDVTRSRARLANGARVKLRGRLSLYEPRGSFQMIANLAVPTGEGDLAAEFERRKKRLEAEGLFALEKKRPLPRLPRVVGVVTSATGAALQDILRVAENRAPLRLVVADCRVQGKEAPPTIVAALEAIQRLPVLDVVIVGRGGGSSEDLWAFNDEAVVRAIAACRVPIVSAVGHEVDVTLADFAADVRAATPSNAAELVVPEQRVLEQSVQGLLRRLERAMEVRIGRERLRLERMTKELEDPRHALAGARRKLDATTSRLAQTAPRRLVKERGRLLALEQRLLAVDPRAGLARDRQRLATLLHRLERASRAPFEERRRRLVRLETQLAQLGPSIVDPHRAALRELAAKLDAMSPLRVLDRGYAIALHERTGKAVRKVADVKKGDAVKLRLSDGTVHARIDEP